MRLAERAGINTPARELLQVGGRAVLLSRRFDRDGTIRIPFLSALAMTGSKDGEHGSYPGIVDALARHGAQAVTDAQALCGRVAFSVLISNVDDHLRNHGFLWRSEKGWAPSPAYDLNPVPIDLKALVLTTEIDLDEGTCSIDLLEAASHNFELGLAAARTVIKEVAVVTATCRQTAKDVGARSAEVARMASAFEQDDLKRALVLRPGRHLDGRPLSGNSAVNRPGFPGFLTVVVFLPTCSAILRWVNLVLACFKQFQRLDGGLFCSHRSPMSFPPRVCGDLATRRTGVRRFCASANVNCRTKRTFRAVRGRGPRRERAVSCSGSFCKRTGRETHNRPARRRGDRKDPVGNFVMVSHPPPFVPVLHEHFVSSLRTQRVEIIAPRLCGKLLGVAIPQWIVEPDSSGRPTAFRRRSANCPMGKCLRVVIC